MVRSIHLLLQKQCVLLFHRYLNFTADFHTGFESSLILIKLLKQWQGYLLISLHDLYLSSYIYIYIYDWKKYHVRSIMQLPSKNKIRLNLLFVFTQTFFKYKRKYYHMPYYLSSLVLSISSHIILINGLWMFGEKFSQIANKCKQLALNG